MTADSKEKPFGIKDKLGYMFGDFGNDFTFIFASSFLMVFYTNVLGIDPKMVGVLFLVARVVDAFTDIGMGSSAIFQRWKISSLDQKNLRAGGICQLFDVSVIPGICFHDSEDHLYVCHLHSLGIHFVHSHQYPIWVYGISYYG